ncbi:MAG: DUF167 domain-containing protein [Rickettsiales bacterium]
MIDLFNYKDSITKLKVRVTPKAKDNRVTRVTSENGEGLYKIYVTAPAEDGKANKAVIELIAREFGIKKYNVTIEKGERCRDKIIRIIR